MPPEMGGFLRENEGQISKERERSDDPRLIKNRIGF